MEALQVNAKQSQIIQSLKHNATSTTAFMLYTSKKNRLFSLIIQFNCIQVFFINSIYVFDPLIHANCKSNIILKQNDSRPLLLKTGTKKKNVKQLVMVRSQFFIYKRVRSCGPPLSAIVPTSQVNFERTYPLKSSLLVCTLILLVRNQLLLLIIIEVSQFLNSELIYGSSCLVFYFLKHQYFSMATFS